MFRCGGVLSRMGCSTSPGLLCAAAGADAEDALSRWTLAVWRLTAPFAVTLLPLLACSDDFELAASAAAEIGANCVVHFIGDPSVMARTGLSCCPALAHAATAGAFKKLRSSGVFDVVSQTMPPPRPRTLPDEHVFTMEEISGRLGEEAATRLRESGFFRVMLPPSAATQVKEVRAAVGKYFHAYPTEAKNEMTFEKNAYVRAGYYGRPDMGKELLQYRRFLPGSPQLEWPERWSSLRDSADEAFRSLGDVAHRCYEAVTRLVSVNPRVMAALGELSREAEPAADVSLSVLDLFSYYSPPREGLETCEMHTDNGFITVIPRCQGPAALEVHSWDASGDSWVPVEDGLDEDVAIVMAGEALEKATRGVFLATPHRVTLPDIGRAAVGEQRISTPMLYFPHPRSILNKNSLRPGFPQINWDEAPVVTARWIEDFASKRKSATFVSRATPAGGYDAAAAEARK